MLGKHDATETGRIIHAAEPRPLSGKYNDATEAKGIVHAAKPRPLSLSERHEAHRGRGDSTCSKATPTDREVQ